MNNSLWKIMYNKSMEILKDKRKDKIHILM